MRKDHSSLHARNNLALPNICFDFSAPRHPSRGTPPPQLASLTTSIAWKILEFMLQISEQVIAVKKDVACGLLFG